MKISPNSPKGRARAQRLADARATRKSEQAANESAAYSAKLDREFCRGERDAAAVSDEGINELLSGIRRVIGQSNLTEGDRVYYRALRNALTARLIAKQVNA